MKKCYLGDMDKNKSMDFAPIKPWENVGISAHESPLEKIPDFLPRNEDIKNVQPPQGTHMAPTPEPDIPGKLRYPQDFGRGNPLYVIQLNDEFFEQDPRSIVFRCAWWKEGFENPVLTEEQSEAAHFDMLLFAQQAYDRIKEKERFHIVRY